MVTISTLGYTIIRTLLVIGHFTYFIFVVDRVLNVKRLGYQEWNTYWTFHHTSLAVWS